MSLRVLSFDVGTKNLALCDLVVTDNSFRVNSWSVQSCVARGINVNKTPVQDLAPFFYKFVRGQVHSWFYNKDETKKDIQQVFIEAQPLGGRGAARNLKTKVLSHILQCVIAEEAPDVSIRFIHPSLKLKDMPKKEDGSKSSYRENKLYAIQKTTEYVEGQSCQTKELCKEAYLDKKIKKDDLADAFLQGLLAGGALLRNEFLESPTEVKKKKAKAADGAEPKVVSPNLKRKREETSETTEETAKKPKKAKVGVKSTIASEALQV
jgi:hypothetical protein